MRWLLILGLGGALKPIQLVRPVANYTKLEVTEEGLAFLNGIKESVAVIAAVGAIHTGKSFLLNQLCDSTTGFSVGYTVRPETHGIWAMQYPNLVPSTFNSRHSRITTKSMTPDFTTVLFLDTEGLFSRDASSAYDARLFAITTLLSSEVIYNTVKFIDTHHMEALETLIRRTNLFGLRAYAARGAGVQERVSNLSEFLRLLVPSHLSWVVQDFVQDLENLSPESWLQHLLEGAGGNSDGHVHNFFKSIDCITLPIPAASHDVLQKLDTVDSDDLDPTYREKISNFRMRLLKRASQNPKLKTSLTSSQGNSPMTGADIADLLTFLVESSNAQPSSNSPEDDQSPFPELPSVAEQFTKLQLRLMKSDILTIVERDIRQIISRQVQNDAPMCDYAFEQELNRQADHAKKLWHATITGVIQHKSLTGSLSDAEADFILSLDQSKDKLRQVNFDEVKVWCEQFINTLLGDFKERVSEQMKGEGKSPDDMDILIAQAQAPIQMKFKSVLNSVQGTPEACQNEIPKFAAKLKETEISLRAENDATLAREIDDLSREVVHKFINCATSYSGRELGEIPHAELVEKSKTCEHAALQDFGDALSKYSKVSVMQLRRVETKARLDAESERILEKWRNICAEQANRFISRVQTNFQMEVRRNAPLPCDDEFLTNQINSSVQEWRNKYTNEVICARTEPGTAHDIEFERVINAVRTSMMEANEKSLSDIHSHVLSEVQNEMSRSIDSYYWASLFRKDAEVKCLKAIEKAWKNYNTDVDDQGLKARGVGTFSKELLARSAKRYVATKMENDLMKINFSVMTRAACVGVGLGMLSLVMAATGLWRVVVAMVGGVAMSAAVAPVHISWTKSVQWLPAPVSEYHAAMYGVLVTCVAALLTRWLMCRQNERAAEMPKPTYPPEPYAYHPYARNTVGPAELNTPSNAHAFQTRNSAGTYAPGMY